MTQTLGIIGAGMIGSTLARLATAAGIDVVIANSRGPETLTDLVAELGDHARAATVEEAAQAGDIVVVTIPLKGYDTLPAAALSGKTVIDTLNYYPERDGRIAELDSNELTSSQLVQRHLNSSRLVKAFNSIPFVSLAGLGRPAGAADRTALPISGDDEAAKAEATALLDALGYDAVDLGGLDQSWRMEPGQPVYVEPYMPPMPEGLSQAETVQWLMTTPPTPVPAARVTELAGAAVRDAAGGSLLA